MSRYFTDEDFILNFGKEIVSARNVYDRLRKNGLTDDALGTFDVVFISDAKEKLDSLAEFLTSNYGFAMKNVQSIGSHWEVAGDGVPIPVNVDNLIFWALDLYVKGYEFDCVLDGYGAMMDHKMPEFLNVDSTMKDYYFDAGMAAYEKRNLGSAIINWTMALSADPKDANSYYSRAIAKNEIHTWKSALEDYDKSIELAPDFVNALVNRGAVKDEHGDLHGAIGDYDKAIALSPDNHIAYLNRGNAWLNLGDKGLACVDWRKSVELGSQFAQERIEKYCC
jgi:tetratricopeptide (TPR) repeat protein